MGSRAAANASYETEELAGWVVVTPKALYGSLLVESRGVCKTPLGFGFGRFAYPGCAARPWALEWNAFGVRLGARSAEFMVERRGPGNYKPQRRNVIRSCSSCRSQIKKLGLPISQLRSVSLTSSQCLST
jgi:hypothetical protein